ncbi:hypothetical protein J2W49_004020 [Hydrogenophaga palleronii]|uniref:HPr kinase n=1 Tax=Hydrogenophaga palleronii TaxID=65655 RepID=A0ABU1WRV6_9BURK|nr:hypothetical protein [Hydrogenophaga palleronii]MDR7152044.1 hypothetical protein [Hydrogenophaga palleronii]
MQKTDHQILDSAFTLGGASCEPSFFARMDSMYEGDATTVSSAIDIRVHLSSATELSDAVTTWNEWGHFHRSLNYSHWNLKGPVEPAGIYLPALGMLFRFHVNDSRLDVYTVPGRSQRTAELVFHAARNLALWRRDARFSCMLHASAVIVHGAAWLFLGNKGAGKSTLFIDSVLRHGATPLSNDRVLLDSFDGRTIWSWPSYLSYCEGTILDYPELGQVFDAALEGVEPPSARLYRRSYEQAHKRIVPPFHFNEVLGRHYARSAPIAGVVCAQLQPGHADGLTVISTRRTSQMAISEIADAVFSGDDPDFPAWHGVRSSIDANAVEPALEWLAEADVPLLNIVLDPVLGKSGLGKLLVQ